MNTDILGLLVNPFVNTANRFATQIPTIAAAFVLLLAGMFTARALRTLVESLLRKASLDNYTSKVGINEVLTRLGLGKSPSYALSFLVYWFILFIFIVSAANAVNLTVVSDLLERFVLFFPTLIASILILFAGLLFARFLSEVVTNASAANNIGGGSLLARISYVVVLVFSAMTALEQLGMKMAFIFAAVQIVLGSFGLAMAIAFGLGCKDIAEEIIRELLNRKKS